jgi:pimeloyl-ACP methyl ester carboxylesterase
MTVQHRRVTVNGVGLHAVVAGEGSPIVLLHGWPVTWYHWRQVIPLLAERYTVIAPDLRGLGDSDRPNGGYDKRTLADDVVALTEVLGVERFALVGHDFGGTVAYTLAATYPDRVSHLVIEEELLPGVSVPDSLASPRYPRWHNAFHLVPYVPEMLITGREFQHLNLFWSLTAAGSAMPVEALEEYARTYLTPGALRVCLAYYRTAPEDAEYIRRAGRLHSSLPVLTIAGDTAMASAVEACMQQVADHVTSVVLDQCGHYPAEEYPRQVAQLLAYFITD